MSNNRLIDKLNLAGSKHAGNGASGGDAQSSDDANISEMMLDPRYLRQSSALINDALQKGFDVLQLSDGSIVTTGTKTVVHHYRWDEPKGKLVKSKSETSGVVSGRKTRSGQKLEEDSREEDA